MSLYLLILIGLNLFTIGVVGIVWCWDSKPGMSLAMLLIKCGVVGVLLFLLGAVL